MNQSFRDQLKQWKKVNGMQHNDPPIVESPKKIPPKTVDKLSEAELRYLMGTDRRVLYRGKGGAYK